MVLTYLRFAVAAIAVVPLIYYILVLYSAWRFFRDGGLDHDAESQGSHGRDRNPGFTPPISNLKPVRGLDPGAYENFASFCQQDYPQYEVIFCVSDAADPALPVLRRIVRDFPHLDIKVIVGSGRDAANDKVAKLARMTEEASYETLVISDSDVRAKPDYLKSVVAALQDPGVGATTCLYVPAPGEEKTFVQKLQSIGMICDFYPGLLIARELDGVKFALGPTIATTKACLHSIGGYDVLENQPADDLLVGRLIAEQGYEVRLLNYSVPVVSDFGSLRDLFLKRLRWTVVMRNMRPWGHAGMILTFGLLWAVAAVLAFPSWRVAAGYFGAYIVLRAAVTGLVGRWGLKQPGIFKKLCLVPLWDMLAILLWVSSFTRNSIRWRESNYAIRHGQLISLDPSPEAEEAVERI